MAVGQTSRDAEGIVSSDERFSAEDPAEHSNLLAWQGGEIGQGAVLDLAILAIAFAEEVGGG